MGNHKIYSLWTLWTIIMKYSMYEVGKVHEHSTVHHYRLSYLLLMRWNEEIIWCEVEILIYQNNKTPLRYVLLKLYFVGPDIYISNWYRYRLCQRYCFIAKHKLLVPIFQCICQNRIDINRQQYQYRSYQYLNPNIWTN